MLTIFLISLVVAVAAIISSIFDFIRSKLGDEEIDTGPDPNYKPTESDQELIKKSREIIETQFPEGIENTMLTLGIDARIEKIKQLTLDIAETYNIDVSSLVFLNCEQLIERGQGANTAGYFDLENKTIGLNIDILMCNDGRLLRDIVDTIIHECRHAFQYKAIEFPEECGVDPNTALEWLNNFTHYISPQINFRRYYYQPVEYDARNFAAVTLIDL